MKFKLFVLFLFLVIGKSMLQAQNFKKDGESYSCYCQLVSTENPDGSLDIRILFGNLKDAQKLCDFNGSTLSFKTIIEAINFMARRGWYYTEKDKIDSKVYLLFRKTIKNEKESLEGLYFDRSSLTNVIE